MFVVVDREDLGLMVRSKHQFLKLKTRVEWLNRIIAKVEKSLSIFFALKHNPPKV